jgi:hypothetical protein
MHALEQLRRSNSSSPAASIVDRTRGHDTLSVLNKNRARG